VSASRRNQMIFSANFQVSCLRIARGAKFKDSLSFALLLRDSRQWLQSKPTREASDVWHEPTERFLVPDNHTDWGPTPHGNQPTVLCRDCGVAVVPSGHLRQWRYFCNKCYHAHGKATRLARWEGGERPHCRKHRKRIVRRSRWIARGVLVCSACLDRNIDGELRPAVRRKRAKRNKWWRTEVGRAYDRETKRLYRARRRSKR
jgi:hypothetical protein